MPRVIPRISKSRLYDGYEIELMRVTDAGDRLGSHVLSEMSMADMIRLREELDWFLDEGQYQ